MNSDTLAIASPASKKSARRTSGQRIPSATPVADVLAELDAMLAWEVNAPGRQWSQRPQLTTLRTAAARAPRADDFQVVFSSVGNPDHGQTGRAGELSPTIVASSENLFYLPQILAAYVAVYDLGGGNCPEFHVFRSGVEVARISYNGRIWTPFPFGHAHYREIVGGAL